MKHRENTAVRVVVSMQHSTWGAGESKKVSFEKIINITHSINKERDRDMITIETADRPGLLVDIAKVFFKKDMSIFSSRINTLGDKVEDTFEIEGKNKAKISTTKVNEIIKALKEVV